MEEIKNIQIMLNRDVFYNLVAALHAYGNEKMFLN